MESTIFDAGAEKNDKAIKSVHTEEIYSFYLPDIRDKMGYAERPGHIKQSRERKSRY
jgi:hypothetical protein